MSHSCKPAFFRALTAILLLVCLVAPLPVHAEKAAQLKPSNYVNDFASVLDNSTQAKLNAYCLEVQQKTGAQIAVVTIKSLDDVTVDNFAVDLFKAWGVGGKKADNGVLILLSTGDHKYRIEVGYGLEPILPDGKVGGFGREAVPLLRESNYAAAINLLTIRVAQTIAADKGVTITGLPARTQRQAPPVSSKYSGFIVFLFILFILWLGSRGGGRGGRGGGLWWLIPLLMSGSGGSRGGGGWDGGSFGGGGGFGGFGGGGSGGGGASGDW